MRKFNFVDSSKKQDNEQIRESLTYWRDVWRRLKSNKLAMLGLAIIIFVILFAFVGPLFTGYTYKEQVNDFRNIPPSMEVYQITEEASVYLTNDYTLIVVNNDGTLNRRLDRTSIDTINKIYYYDFNGEEIGIDYSYRLLDEGESDVNYSVLYQDQEILYPTRTTHNMSYLLGTDHLGKDILTRLMHGARISLIVAVVATIVNLIIGVTYGALSGFAGGGADSFMMRVVDVINSVPLVIYVILLMVILDKSNMWTVILAIGTVYWVGMARLVRGQVVSLKNQEFVLAARAIGVKQNKIIFRHLIPNALGPIIVSLTMSIPSAIFTEAFLSFIGIGISAPAASWGTMTNESLSSLGTYVYQLLAPSIAIAVTVLSFNFLGDGLRTALDPRLRKG